MLQDSKIAQLEHELNSLKLERNSVLAESNQHRNHNVELRAETSAMRARLQDLELQCENLKNVNMNLNAMQAENLRLHGVDEDLKRAHAEIFEGQEIHRRCQEKIQELEANMGRKIAEL